MNIIKTLYHWLNRKNHPSGGLKWST